MILRPSRDYARVLTIIALTVVSCSLFDTSTPIGTDLLNDIDPTIADPDAVLSYGKAEMEVLQTTSIRDSSNIRTDFLAVGVLNDEFAWAYFEFDTVVSLVNVRRISGISIRLDPTPANKNVSAASLRFSLDSCAKKDSSAIFSLADIRRSYSPIAFTRTAAGTYTADSVLLSANDIIVEIKRYYPGAHLSDTISFDTVRSKITLITDTSFVICETSSWQLASYDSSTVPALVAATRAQPADSFIIVSRLSSSDIAYTDTIFYTHSLTADTLTSVRRSSRHDTTRDTSVVPKGTVLTREQNGTVRIDKVLSSPLTILRSHRYDSLVTRTAVQRTLTTYRLVLPDQRDTLSVPRVFADTFLSDSLSISVTVADTLELDSNGVCALVRYDLSTALPVDSTHVRLRHPFFALRPVVMQQNGIIRIFKPYLQIRHSDSAGTSVVSQRVNCTYADFHVYERNPYSRDTLAFCSAGARRYCRVLLDMRQLWDSVRVSAQRCTLQTVLGAVVSVPVAQRWREFGARVDTLLYALTSDSAVPTSVVVRNINTNNMDIIRLDLQRDLNALWNNGAVTTDTGFLHVWLPQTRDKEWATIELVPAGTTRKMLVEFFLTAVPRGNK